MKDKKTQTNDNLTTTVEQTVTLDPTVVPIDKLVLAPKMQACLNVLPRCSLSYAKIMQTECRTSSLLERFAEVQLILCKFK